MENFRFNHIGQTDSPSESFSFPRKRTPRSDTARTGPSLLDRMSQNEKTHTELSNFKRPDVAQHPSRSPKTARQPKRVRPEASLANRISAPDGPALLGRISAPEVQPHRPESLSPPNEKGSSSGSELAGPQSPKATAPLQPPIVDDAATVILPNLPSQALSDVHQPPDPAAVHITSTALDTVMQTNLTTKLLETLADSARLSITSIPSSQTAALPASAHQSITATIQSSSSSLENHTNLNSRVLSSPSALGASAAQSSVEPSTLLSTGTLLLPDTVPTTKSSLPSSSAPSSFSTSPSAPSVPTSSPSFADMATTVPSQRSETLASSPAKTAPDMLAFYLKPLWAESAAQMLEWAEVANERALGESATGEASRSKAIGPQQDSNEILLKVSSVPREGDRSGEKETDIEWHKEREGEKAGETNKSKGQDGIEAEGKDGNNEKDINEGERGGVKAVANPIVGQKRPREDGDAEVEKDKLAKRIKPIAAHDVLPIAPPLPTPSASFQSEAEVEQVVAEQKTKLTGGVCDDVSGVEAHLEAALAQDSRNTKEVLADEKATLDNASPPRNTDPLCIATRHTSPELEPRDKIPSREEPPLDGPRLDAPQQPVTSTLPQEPTGALVSSPPTETIDEATAARRRNLELELSFHVREEQERLRQSQAKRTKQPVEDHAERIRKAAEEHALKLKQREDELREAMKSRKIEKVVPQAVPSSVPGQVIVAAPALNAGTIPSSTSSFTAAGISPPRVPHPLPARPLSGGVALGAAPSEKAVTIPHQAISQNTPQSSKALPQTKKNQNQNQQITPTSPLEVPGSVADVASSLLPSPLALPVNDTPTQTLTNVKKEEPVTPVIPRVAASGPLKAQVTSTDGSNAEQPEQGLPSLIPSLERDVKVPAAQSSSEKPDIPVKAESSPDRYLEPQALTYAAKRPRSSSLAASVPPVVKKRRESSAPTALELTYPNVDVASEVTGWGHVEVDVDDEEQRPGRRRRMRTRTPDDTDGREPPLYSTPPPPPRSKSRSRTRSRSPLRSTGGRGFPYPRGPRRGRGRGGRNALADRPIERYESRYSPPLRNPNPPRLPRQRSPIETRPVYDHYSPPRRGRDRLDQRGTDHHASHRAYVSSDQRPADSYTLSLTAGPRHDSGFPDPLRSPPHERDSYAPRRSPLVDQNVVLSRLPLPRSRSPPRDSRRPPGPSAIRLQNADPSRYPYPRPTSPLRRTTRTIRESQPQPPRRVRPDGPSAVRSQNVPSPLTNTPPHLHFPQDRSPPQELHSLPPAQPAMVNSQYTTLSRMEASRPRDYALGDHTSLSSSLGQLSSHYNGASRSDTRGETSRGQGSGRPMPSRLLLDSDDQRAAKQHRPHSRNHQMSSGEHETIVNEFSTTHERIPQSPTQRSLMNRITPGDPSKANIEPQSHSLGTHNANESSGSRGRGSSHRGSGASGGRMKLAARLSDAQTGGSLMRRVGPQ